MPFFKLCWKGRPHSHVPRIRDEADSTHRQPSLRSRSHRAARNALRRSFSSDLKRARKEAEEAASRRPPTDKRLGARAQGKKKARVTSERTTEIASSTGQGQQQAKGRSGRKKRPSLWKAPSLEFAGVTLSKEKRPAFWRWPSFDPIRQGSTSNSTDRGERDRSAEPSEPSSSLFFPPGDDQRSWLASLVRDGSGKTVSEAVTPAPPVSSGRASLDLSNAESSQGHGFFDRSDQLVEEEMVASRSGEVLSLKWEHPNPGNGSGGMVEGFQQTATSRDRRSSTSSSNRTVTDQRPPQQKRRRSLGAIAVNQRKQLRVGSLADMSTINEGSGSHVVSSEAIITENLIEGEKVQYVGLEPGQSMKDLQEDKRKSNGSSESGHVQQLPAESISHPSIRSAKTSVSSSHDRTKSESGLTSFSQVTGSGEILTQSKFVSTFRISQAELRRAKLDSSNDAGVIAVGMAYGDLTKSARPEAQRNVRRLIWERAMEAREQREREQMMQRRAALMA
ncbi:MAG: hypothetical protein M1814_004767 [Vezdaea aestivalis]|nr:MAG: hypothetical protein M1814_004767 [Vezdaea aestivalis]